MKIWFLKKIILESVTAPRVYFVLFARVPKNITPSFVCCELANSRARNQRAEFSELHPAVSDAIAHGRAQHQHRHKYNNHVNE